VPGKRRAWSVVAGSRFSGLLFPPSGSEGEFYHIAEGFSSFGEVIRRQGPASRWVWQTLLLGCHTGAAVRDLWAGLWYPRFRARTRQVRRRLLFVLAPGPTFAGQADISAAR
jgi:hypothetical protein